MMHKAWSSIEEVPYCFSRSSVKFQGHIALKIVEFDSNWAFPDCNSSLNSAMAMKCCTKLETAKKRCPIVNQGHPSNFKVTRDKTSPILTQIGRFRTIGRSQLSNPSDLPCSSKSNRKVLQDLNYELINLNVLSFWCHSIESGAVMMWISISWYHKGTTITEKGHKSAFELTKDIPYLTLPGELWGVYCEYLEKIKIDCAIMGWHCIEWQDHFVSLHPVKSTSCDCDPSTRLPWATWMAAQHWVSIALFL